MTSITRREWISSVAEAGSLSTVARSDTRKESKRNYEIIDGHVHVWTSNTEKYRLALEFTKDDLWFPSFSVKDLVKHYRPGLNFVQMTWYGLDHS